MATTTEEALRASREATSAFIDALTAKRPDAELVQKCWDNMCMLHGRFGWELPVFIAREIEPECGKRRPDQPEWQCCLSRGHSGTCLLEKK
jgi:hypothetical protein